MGPTLIGFGYQARTGKDTAAKAIVEARGKDYDIRVYPFAKALKDEYTEACREAGSAYELMQVMRVTHNLPDWVQYEIEPDMSDPLCPYGKQRTFLQWWGTEYRRAQDENYWVNKTDDAIHRDNPDFALITDVRFPNEFDYVHSLGGHTVHVVRVGVGAVNGHASESALANHKFDYTLYNMGNRRFHEAAVYLFDDIDREACKRLRRLA